MKISNRILHGDSYEILQTVTANTFDAVVTDPPYALTDKRDYRRASSSKKQRDSIGKTGGFMGCEWDSKIPDSDLWAEVLRVSKPGAFLLAFGGTRTYHRLTCNIEDAGWEIRDCLMWLYGCGFPKSKNLDGIGTALKPSWEPIIMARKPLTGSVAANHAEHGTGCMNIDECRIQGKRWPANLLLDSAAAVILDEQSGERKSGGNVSGKVRSAPFSGKVYGEMEREGWNSHNDSGGASRFFYTAKATQKDRGAGNIHPTVKPTDLMAYLVKLVCPPSGLVLDPFFGSGSTGIAASLVGRNFCGIEREAQYVEIAKSRLQQRSPLLLAAGSN